MCQQSHNECAEFTHCLKKACLYFAGVSNFSGGFKSCRFVIEAESAEALHV